jgi:hypothetical protein
MHVVRVTLVIGSHVAASAQGAVSMLRISSERRDRSMKWLSIFEGRALGRFSRCKQWQTDSSRGGFSLLPLWEKVARSAG